MLLIDKETTAKALNLAMAIELGSMNPKEVIKALREDKQGGIEILKFWMGFNDMTKNAVNILISSALEDINQVGYLEHCWGLN